MHKLKQKIVKDCFLEGKNIYLRQAEPADVKKWYKWFNNKKITSFMDQGRYPNTYEKQLIYLKRIYLSNTDIQLAIVEKKSDDLVGTIGLHQIDLINRNADLSIVVGETKFFGQGIGKEAVSLLMAHAFNTLNLHKLTAGMCEENKASVGLFVSLGFKREALLWDQIYLAGRYRNIIKLGLINKGLFKAAKKL